MAAAGIGTEALDWAHRCLASRDFPQQAFRSVRDRLDLAGKHGNAAVEQAWRRRTSFASTASARKGSTGNRRCF